MAHITDTEPTRTSSPHHPGPVTVIAAIASAGAGLVHVAAALEHDGDPTLTWLFALCALAQIGWAVVVVGRPARRVLLFGVALNALAVTTWVASRTTGIALVDGLSDPESVGLADGIAALLAFVSVVTAGIAVIRPAAWSEIAGSRTLVATGALTLFLAVPAMAAPHEHDDGDHHSHVDVVAAAGHEHGDGDHTDGHDDGSHDGHDGSSATHDGHDGGDGHVDGDLAMGTSHEHGTGVDGDDGHDHGTTPTASPDGHTHGGTDPTTPTGGHDHDPGTTPATGGGGHDHDPDTPPTTGGGGGHDHDPDPDPTGPIVSLDDPRLTPQQRAAASALLNSTRAAMAAFPDEAAVTAAGYRWVGDSAGGFHHYVKWEYLADGRELDPSAIESIVLLEQGGGLEVVSAMYILSPGKTMDDVPDIAGELTPWHDHQNLCWDETGTRIVGVLQNGVCTAGTFRPTPPMMHVWLEDTPCGPFAPVEGHGGDCLHDH